MGGVRVMIELDIEPPEGEEAGPTELPDLPCEIDTEYGSVPVWRIDEERSGAVPSETRVVNAIVRGQVEPGDIERLRGSPGVYAVWSDPEIVPFAGWDCDDKTARGSAEDVARALGATLVWEAGCDGAGVVIGIVDGGVDRQRFPAVTGGWSPDPASPWGTAPGWFGHGNMCAFDSLVAAPKAMLYDYAVGKAGPVTAVLSSALQAFQRALERHREDGTPHILSNSWGLAGRSQDPFPPGDPSNYTHNPEHVFVRKAMELIDEGILLVFAAGNCGEHCNGCGDDTGPGCSILGLNGHPRVITVGAVNPLGGPIGYSSQGPSTLAPQKPDICGYSHFAGFKPCDAGTSAACPVVAGVLALLRQRSSGLQQDRARELLTRTARPIHGLAHHPSTGFGVLDAARAFKGL